jgi:hypothetical protein
LPGAQSRAELREFFDGLPEPARTIVFGWIDSGASFNWILDTLGALRDLDLGGLRGVVANEALAPLFTLYDTPLPRWIWEDVAKLVVIKAGPYWELEQGKRPAFMQEPSRLPAPLRQRFRIRAKSKPVPSPAEPAAAPPPPVTVHHQHDHKHRHDYPAATDEAERRAPPKKDEAEQHDLKKYRAELNQLQATGKRFKDKREACRHLLLVAEQRGWRIYDLKYLERRLSTVYKPPEPST